MTNDQLRCLPIDKQGTHRHSSLELQRFPVGGVEGQRDSIVLDAGLGLLAQLSALGNQVHQFAGHGNLALWLLGERDADGIANALRQQCTDTHSRLDAAVFAFTSLSDAQMQRIVHVFQVHRLHQQAHGSHHDHSI